MSNDGSLPSRKAAQSGLLRSDGCQISYSSDHYGSFSIPLRDIAVIGEFTTSEGPALDDWFLVFVPRNGDQWFEASMYAEGSSELLDHLSATLGCPLTVGLANSAQVASRIIWPAALADSALFAFAGDSCGLSSKTLSAIERTPNQAMQRTAGRPDV